MLPSVFYDFLMTFLNLEAPWRLPGTDDEGQEEERGVSTKGSPSPRAHYRSWRPIPWPLDGDGSHGAPLQDPKHDAPAKLRQSSPTRRPVELHQLFHSLRRLISFIFMTRDVRFGDASRKNFDPFTFINRQAINKKSQSNLCTSVAIAIMAMVSSLLTR